MSPPPTIVPRGMIFDGASIPWWGWWIAGPPLRNAARPAAVIHDAAYKGELRCRVHSGESIPPPDRLTADHMLREACRWRGVSERRSGLIYRAVRIGGQKPWDREHAKTTHIQELRAA